MRARSEVDVGPPRIRAHLPEEIALERVQHRHVTFRKVRRAARIAALRGAVRRFELFGDAERQKVVDHDALHADVDERLQPGDDLGRRAVSDEVAGALHRQVVGRIPDRRGRHPLRDVVAQAREAGAERVLQPGPGEDVGVPREGLDAQQDALQRLLGDVVVLVDDRVEVDAGHDGARIAARGLRRALRHRQALLVLLGGGRQHRQPPGAVPADQLEQTVRVAPEDDLDRRRRRGPGARHARKAVEREVLTPEGHRAVGVEQARDNLERLPQPADRPGPGDPEWCGVETLARAEAEHEPARGELAQGRRGLGDRGRMAPVGVGDRDPDPGAAGRHQRHRGRDEGVRIRVRVVDDLGQHPARLAPQLAGVPGHQVVRVPERIDALGLGQHRRARRDRARAVRKAHGADLDHDVRSG